VVERFHLLPIDLPTARVHAQMWADLAAAGTMVGMHDLWLGAASLAHDLTIATANLRDFSRIPGVILEDWSPATG
jgi:tRNA(fMet)-specific endonuclease VapC